MPEPDKTDLTKTTKLPAVDPLTTTVDKKADNTDRELAVQLGKAVGSGDQGAIGKAIGAVKGKLTEIVTVSILVVLTTLVTFCKDSVIEWVTRRHDNSPIKLEAIAERDTHVRDLMIQLRINLGADRVYVLLLHNGVTMASGDQLRRFSCQYEVVRDGISSEIRNLQNVPLSELADVLKMLGTGKDPGFTEVSKMPGTTSWKTSLKNRGIMFVCDASMQIPTGTTIGFIGVNWNAARSAEFKEEDAAVKVKDAAERIALLITNPRTR